MYVAFYKPTVRSSWHAGATLYRSRKDAEEYLATLGPHYRNHIAYVDLP